MRINIHWKIIWLLTTFSECQLLVRFLWLHARSRRHPDIFCPKQNIFRMGPFQLSVHSQLCPPRKSVPSQFCLSIPWPAPATGSKHALLPYNVNSQLVGLEILFSKKSKAVMLSYRMSWLLLLQRKFCFSLSVLDFCSVFFFCHSEDYIWYQSNH